jgi:hypothetical protein
MVAVIVPEQHVASSPNVIGNEHAIDTGRTTRTAG